MWRSYSTTRAARTAEWTSAAAFCCCCCCMGGLEGKNTTLARATHFSGLQIPFSPETRASLASGIIFALIKVRQLFLGTVFSAIWSLQRAGRKHVYVESGDARPLMRYASRWLAAGEAERMFMWVSVKTCELRNQFRRLKKNVVVVKMNEFWIELNLLLVCRSSPRCAACKNQWNLESLCFSSLPPRHQQRIVFWLFFPSSLGVKAFSFTITVPWCINHSTSCKTAVSS